MKTVCETTFVPRSARKRTLATTLLALVFGCLLGAQSAQAHPQIQIETCPPVSGGLPFYLWWNRTSTTAGPIYIVVTLFDCQGNVLPGYPLADPTPYFVPPTQTTPQSCPLAAPTGTENVDVPNACYAQIIAAGPWNTASSFQPLTKAAAAKKRAAAPAATHSSVSVHHGEKRFVHGQPTKFDLWLEVTNTTGSTAKMQFTYSVFVKTDPDNGALIPIPETDANRIRHHVRVVNHDGNPVYLIPDNSGSDPYIVKDLQIDMSKGGILPTDYVYMDVTAVDFTNGTTITLRRRQLQP